MVQKQQREASPRNEPYQKFLDELLKSKEKDNIFFPRVYKIKTYTDSDYNSTYKYTIEKLLPLDTLDKEEIIEFAKRYIDADKIEDNPIRDKNDFCGFIAIAVRSSNYFNAIKDEELRKAVRFIRQMIKKHYFTNDMVPSNFMLRQTKYGYQLVITDPVA